MAARVVNFNPYYLDGVPFQTNFIPLLELWSEGYLEIIIEVPSAQTEIKVKTTGKRTTQTNWPFVHGSYKGNCQAVTGRNWSWTTLSRCLSGYTFTVNKHSRCNSQTKHQNDPEFQSKGTQRETRLPDEQAIRYLPVEYRYRIVHKPAFQRRKHLYLISRAKELPHLRTA